MTPSSVCASCGSGDRAYLSTELGCPSERASSASGRDWWTCRPTAGAGQPGPCRVSPGRRSRPRFSRSLRGSGIRPVPTTRGDRPAALGPGSESLLGQAKRRGSGTPALAVSPLVRAKKTNEALHRRVRGTEPIAPKGPDCRARRSTIDDASDEG